VAITMRAFTFLTPLLGVICGRSPGRAVSGLLRLVRAWRGHAKAKRPGSFLLRRMLLRIAGREAAALTTAIIALPAQAQQHRHHQTQGLQGGYGAAGPAYGVPPVKGFSYFGSNDRIRKFVRTDARSTKRPIK
jgi:hypothetical protein